jgi:hypothetical protein
MISTAETKIEVTRKEGKLTSIKVIMPTWHDHGDDGQIYTTMPFLGGLTTYSLDHSDSEIAIKEAIHCFCIASEKHGMGVERELQSLGWEVDEESQNSIILSIPTMNQIFDLVVKTGETKALDIEMEAA